MGYMRKPLRLLIIPLALLLAGNPGQPDKR